MKIEDQVCSLELAKQLKVLGVEQDSWLYWHITKKDGVLLTDSRIFRPCFTEHKYIETKGRNVTGGSIEVYSAFTIAELGGMLPDWVDFTQKHYNSTTKKTWYRCYTKEGMMWIDEKNEVDSRAKMLIFLLKNNLIKIKGAKKETNSCIK